MSRQYTNNCFADKHSGKPTNQQTKGQRASHTLDVRMHHHHRHHHHHHQHQHHHHHHTTSTTPPATACIAGAAPHFCIWMFSWSLRSSSNSLSCSFSWICSISLAAPISCSSLRCRSISSWILMEAWRSTCTPSHKNNQRLPPRCGMYIGFQYFKHRFMTLPLNLLLDPDGGLVVHLHTKSRKQSTPASPVRNKHWFSTFRAQVYDTLPPTSA